MDLQLQRTDFQVIVEPTGYMVYFKGHGVGGAGTISRHYQKENRGNWRTKQADRKMYAEMGNRDIENIIQSGEKGQHYNRLIEINQIFNK